jgi:hypothetical protein
MLGHKHEADEPQPREEVALVDPTGEPTGQMTTIKRVISSDRQYNVFEVLDRWNTVLFVEWIEQPLPGRWQQVNESDL